jgi:hypothetical protein
MACLSPPRRRGAVARRAGRRGGTGAAAVRATDFRTAATVGCVMAEADAGTLLAAAVRAAVTVRRAVRATPLGGTDPEADAAIGATAPCAVAAARAASGCPLSGPFAWAEPSNAHAIAHARTRPASLPTHREGQERLALVNIQSADAQVDGELILQSEVQCGRARFVARRRSLSRRWG